MLGIPLATICSRDGEGNGIEVDTMKENDPNNIENEWINRLIHEHFLSWMKIHLWMRSMKIFLLYLLLIKH